MEAGGKQDYRRSQKNAWEACSLRHLAGPFYLVVVVVVVVVVFPSFSSDSHSLLGQWSLLPPLLLECWEG